MSVLRGSLPYFGDNLLLLEDLLDELDAHGLSGPFLLRASEAEKLDNILAHGTDRAGYPGDRRWRHDPTIAHEQVILATTPEENREGEAEPGRSTSLKKFAVIERPLLLVYDARALEQLRPKEYRFRDPDNKPAALQAALEIDVRALPDGWFQSAEGLAYRELARRATSAPAATRRIVEVGCWLGRSTSYLAGLCRTRSLTLDCIDHWTGSSDVYDADYRQRLATRDVEAEFRAHLHALGLSATVHRSDSQSAASRFADASLDLVFLDASHDQAAVTADISAWVPKLRAGGVLAGHDYDHRHQGVVAAVDVARQLGRTLWRGPGSLWSLS